MRECVSVWVHECARVMLYHQHHACRVSPSRPPAGPLQLPPAAPSPLQAAPPPSSSSPGLSKTALHGLASALASELGQSGVRVNVVSPGVIQTDFSKMIWQNDAVADSLRQQTMLGRLGTSEDVAGVRTLPFVGVLAAWLLLMAIWWAARPEKLHTNGGDNLRRRSCQRAINVTGVLVNVHGPCCCAPHVACALQVVAFLLSKDAAYVTAECITVAGGTQSRL
jgi:NAD(P)-dependent dehydrogenase (short-subunit alcohol dehydrogenase family)